MLNLFIRSPWVLAFAVLGLLFSNAPQVQAQYKIAPGDQLGIEVVEDSSLNRNILVLPDGSINFPYVGTLRASGRTPQALEKLLSSRMASNFAIEPTVFVTVGAVAVSETTEVEDKPYGIYLMGEINQPGRLDIDEDEQVTLLQAIAQAGGFTRFAATKRIELRRPNAQGEQIYVFNYKKNSGISGSTKLIPGDVVVIPERRLFE